MTFAAATICLGILAQAIGVPEFEVASVKASVAGAPEWSMSRGVGGRFMAENVPLAILIEFAYDVPDEQVEGAPLWVKETRYSIEAKPDRTVAVGAAGDAAIKVMLQRLLSDRFQLSTHRETGRRAVYALIVGKHGPRLVEAAPDAKGPNVSVSRGQIEGSKAKMDVLARELSNVVGRTVVDETGLTREYDFTVTFAPDTRQTTDAAAALVDGPSIFTALQEQLGLKLEAKSEPVQLLVIDHVSKPSEN